MRVTTFTQSTPDAAAAASETEVAEAFVALELGKIWTLILAKLPVPVP